jgi:hypothetical protein
VSSKQQLFKTKTDQEPPRFLHTAALVLAVSAVSVSAKPATPAPTPAEDPTWTSYVCSVDGAFQAWSCTTDDCDTSACTDITSFVPELAVCTIGEMYGECDGTTLSMYMGADDGNGGCGPGDAVAIDFTCLGSDEGDDCTVLITVCDDMEAYAAADTYAAVSLNENGFFSL